MIKVRFISTFFLFLNLSSWANGQTVVPLNTGYNHSNSSVYTVGQQDNYWINLASSLPTPAGPAYVVQWVPPWQPDLPAFIYPGPVPVPATKWINARNTINSNVDPVTKTGYSLYRKCFCLMSFTQAKLVADIRGDDNLTVWLNTVLSTLLPAQQGHYSGPVLQFSTTDQSKFHMGVNCLYVLVEDGGGYTGFDLRGYVSAYGLMPMPAAGTAASFEPCGCNFAPPHPTPTGGAATLRTGGEFDDQKVVADILKIAEARRAKPKPSAK
jgi:hypothetical protein